MRPGTARRAILHTMSPEDYADMVRARRAAQTPDNSNHQQTGQ